jgi:PIN domain nuclease of toxin-antitoxin system
LKAVLLDTHVWAWSLTEDDRLSSKAIAAIENATQVLISPISFFEIGQKVRIGKWPEMATVVESLPQILEQQGGSIAALEPQICLAASLLAWEHRDPFDRLIGATALHYNLPLLSADTVFDGLVTRIW